MAFEDILKRLEKEDKTFFKSKGEPEWRLPSGVPSLDNILGGGIPSGSFVQVYGLTGSGKTTLSSTFLGNAIKMGKKCTYIHVEELDKRYMTACGVDFEAPNFTYWSSDYAERIFNTLREGFLDDLDVAVIDSVGFLTSKMVMDTEQVVDKSDKSAPIAATARMMGDFMRKIKQPLFRRQGIIIATNHVTTKFNRYGASEVAAGGLKLQYATSIRMKLWAKPIKDSRSIETSITLDKTKDFDSFGSTTLNIVWKEGIDKIHDIARLAIQGDIAEKKGAWIAYNGNKFQGLEAFKEALKTDETLRNSVLSAISNVIPVADTTSSYEVDENGVITGDIDVT